MSVAQQASISINTFFQKENVNADGKNQFSIYIKNISSDEMLNLDSSDVTTVQEIKDQIQNQEGI
jgi:hypothetical protein